MEGQSNAGDEGETSESFEVSDCTIWIWDLDNEKTREKEDRRFRVVVLEKRTESIVDGEKEKYMDHREHQTGMDTGVVTKTALSYFGNMVRAGGIEDDVMLGRMNVARKIGRPRQDGWTHSMGIRAEPTPATWYEMPEIERDGEELPRL